MFDRDILWWIFGNYANNDVFVIPMYLRDMCVIYTKIKKKIIVSLLVNDTYTIDLPEIFLFEFLFLIV